MPLCVTNKDLERLIARQPATTDDELIAAALRELLRARAKLAKLTKVDDGL
jgi:hypothetical protein